MQSTPPGAEPTQLGDYDNNQADDDNDDILLFPTVQVTFLLQLGHS